MKYLSFFVGTMLALSTLYGGMDPEQKCRPCPPHHHNHSEVAFGSFVTAIAQNLNPTTPNIAFELDLAVEHIRKESDFATFVIEETGNYKVKYGINLNTTPDSVGATFSLHKNGNPISGTEISIAVNSFLISDTFILHFKAGDRITLSIDTTDPVIVAPPIADSNAAYLSLNKIK